MDQTVRVNVTTSASRGDTLDFFVVTGSPEAPIVSLADNNGFPYVRDLYAREKTHQGKKGVHVTVRFDGNARGNELAVNIAQPDMTGDYTVIPLQ